jgi:hypothetical protein
MCMGPTYSDDLSKVDEHRSIVEKYFQFYSNYNGVCQNPAEMYDEYNGI